MVEQLAHLVRGDQPTDDEKPLLAEAYVLVDADHAPSVGLDGARGHAHDARVVV
jgi:hypothetical protein